MKTVFPRLSIEEAVRRFVGPQLPPYGPIPAVRPKDPFIYSKGLRRAWKTYTFHLHYSGGIGKLGDRISHIPTPEEWWNSLSAESQRYIKEEWDY